MVQPLWKRVEQFLKTLNIQLPHDSATLLPEKRKLMSTQKLVHKYMFIAKEPEKQKQPKYQQPMNE